MQREVLTYKNVMLLLLHMQQIMNGFPQSYHVNARIIVWKRSHKVKTVEEKKRGGGQS